MKRHPLVMMSAAAIALGLAACGGDKPAATPTSTSPTPSTTAPDPSETPTFESGEDLLLKDLRDKKERGVITEEEERMLEFLQGADDPLATGEQPWEVVDSGLFLGQFRPHAYFVVKMADTKDVIGREMQITVTFQDADGKELETRYKKQRIHAAGQTLAFSISTRAENPEPAATVKAHYEVLAPLEFTGLNKWERPAFETVHTTKFGTGGDRDLASFQVKNPSDIALKGMDILSLIHI